MNSRKLKVYLFLSVLIVSAAAILLFTVEKSDFTALVPADIIIWTIAAVLSESLAIYYVNGSFFISPIEAVFCGCLLSCGPLTAAITISLTFLLIITKDENRFWHIFNTAARYILLNISHHILIMLVLYHGYHFMTSSTANFQIIPAMIIAPLFFTLSCLINAFFYKVEDGEPVKQAFLDMFDPYYQTAVPASLAAVIIAMAYAEYRYFAILILISPFIVTLITMRSEARKSR